MKVYIYPPLATMEANTGIGRVIHAQHKHLPPLGVELVEDHRRADVIAVHTQQKDLPRVDVLHLHGCYWTGDPGSGVYGSWHGELNGLIMQAARRAREITVPAPWVAEPFKRDMRLNPTVIGHGIDIDEWLPRAGDKRGEFLLFNKNRPSDVCDPTPAWELARRGIPTVSTFAPEGKGDEHLQVIGLLPAEQMRACIRQADIYLATTQETFGVGTLEALGAGVPVLGYAWAGTRDIVRHGIDGYLASPHDINDLVEGYHWIKQNRAALSQAAIERAREFSWQKAAEQYAALYANVHHTPLPRVGTAVVITVFNYGRFLAECIESVLRQTLPAAEIVVVDDGSTDDTAEVAARYKGLVRYHLQGNQGVAAARNNGVRLTTAPFVVCLDADDRLGSRYIEAVQETLAADYGHGIAYTGLGLIRPDGSVSENVWKGEFNWEWQASAAMPPHTTIPTAATFTRRAFERVGGYRQYYAPGEDAEFYTRLLAAGFTAVRSTTSPLIEYRDHGEGAHKRLSYVSIDDDKPWMRDSLFPMAAPASEPPLIQSYSEPLVSVIMPVGPRHHVYLARALASLEGQTWRKWEVIVVNDSGAPLPPETLAPYPYVRVVELNRRAGAGAARNAGIALADAPFVLFLDADDQLMPDAMRKLLTAFTEHEGRYIYTQWARWDEHGALITMDVPEYDPQQAMRTGLHAVTALMATADALAVRFDEQLPAMEDYEFFAHAAAEGVHGWKLAEPLVIVDVESGLRTRAYAKDRDVLTASIRSRYDAYLMGATMAKSCCGSGGASVMAAKARLGLYNEGDTGGGDSFSTMGDSSLPNTMRMKYIGNERGASSYFGEEGRVYRAGDNPIDRFINAHPNDVEKLKRTGLFETVAQVADGPAAMRPQATADTFKELPPIPMSARMRTPPAARPEVAPVQQAAQGAQAARPNGQPMPMRQKPAGMVLGDLSDIRTTEVIPNALSPIAPLPPLTPLPGEAKPVELEAPAPMPAALRPTAADAEAWPGEDTFSGGPR